MTAVFCYSIVDFEDPKDRIIQVLKWYLSAFHAGRKVWFVILLISFYICDFCGQKKDYLNV